MGIRISVDLSKLSWCYHFRLKLCWLLLRLIDPKAARDFDAQLRGGS